MKIYVPIETQYFAAASNEFQFPSPGSKDMNN